MISQRIELLLIDKFGKDAERTSKKQTYKYLVRNEEGKLITGYFAALSRLDVHSYLLDEGYEVIETELPALVTVVKSINDPRLPTVRGTMKANRTEIPVWSAEDIEVNVEKIGFKGSPTQVRKIFAPPARTQGEMIQADDVQTAAAALAAKLKEAKIL